MTSPHSGPQNPSRRQLLRRSALLLAAAPSGFDAIATHIGAHTGPPLRLQLPAAGGAKDTPANRADRLGALMAIEEQNRRGGIAGRRLQCQFGAFDPARPPQAIIGAVHPQQASRLALQAEAQRVLFLNTNTDLPLPSPNALSWRLDLAQQQQAILAHGRGLGLTRWGRISDRPSPGLDGNDATFVGHWQLPPFPAVWPDLAPQLAKQAVDGVLLDLSPGSLAAIQGRVHNQSLTSGIRWFVLHRHGQEQTTLPAFGTTASNWHPAQIPPWAAPFLARYQRRFSEEQVSVPGAVFYNAYIASRHLLNAWQDSGQPEQTDLNRHGLHQARFSPRSRLQFHSARLDARHRCCRQQALIIALQRKIAPSQALHSPN